MKDLLDILSPGAPTPGEILKALRKRENFTLKDLEEITGMRQSNLSAIETGSIEMTQFYAERFAVVFDVHPTIFLYPNGQFAKDEELVALEKRAKLFRKNIKA